ncbi:auxin efflux carrier [Mycena crocata]|nr:auxin efflux carrier [Mycena crocata]
MPVSHPNVTDIHGQLAVSSGEAEGSMFPLLMTVFKSILEVFLLCLAGYVMAWRGILDKRTIKHLNRLNIGFFTPSLLFSKVAFFLSPEKLKELWVIPIFFVIVTLVSMTVSVSLSSVFRVTRTQRNFALAAAMFMNSNSLPVALMQSLVLTIPALKWGPDDDNNAMVGRALTYLLLYSTIGMVLRWSVGWQLLTSADPHPEKQVLDLEGRDTLEETSALIGTDEEETPKPNSYKWFPKSPNQSRQALELENLPLSSASSSSTVVPSPDDSYFQDHHRDPEVALLVHLATVPRGASATLHRTWTRVGRMLATINGFMTAPLWAAIASILVACIAPLQEIFKEHMHPVKGALSSAGNCSIPVTLVVLGGYFYPKTSADAPVSEKTFRGAQEKQIPGQRAGAETKQEKEAYPGEAKTVAIAVVSRMILTPIILLPFMAWCAKYDFQDVFQDPVFVVANVLLVSSPPALTLAQISQAASGDAFERLITRTIFWAYCIVTPIATIGYAVIGLKMSAF